MAKLIVKTEATGVGRGGAVTASVRLQSGRTAINATEGTLTYPANLLELREIRDGNSVVNFWIERPSPGSAPGQIRWSGVTPGGYSGDDGQIFSLVFEAVKEGAGSLSIRDALAAIDDGKGTPAPLTLESASISVATASAEAPVVSATTTIAAEIAEDRDPPESFRIEVGRDPEAFSGKWFAAFSAEDKGTGIAYYEITENGRDAVRVSSGPFVLQDQSRRSTIIIRAVDKAGNAREETLTPPPPGPRVYNGWELTAAVGAVILLALWAYLHGRLRRVV